MFLRCTTRKKNGKEHRYWNLVENRRVAGGQVVQHQVLYLGEINDSQQEVWRKSIEVFEDGRNAPRTVALFAEDQRAPVDDEQVIQVRLKDLIVRNARQWGACWLACEIYEQLKLDQFWAERLPPSRKGTRWDLILETLCVYRLIDPGSEWRLHRHWFDRSAMADLLGSDFRLAESHRLYDCHDLLLKHKEALFTHLSERWKDLFNAKFDVLLYDLTSTYFESDPPTLAPGLTPRSMLEKFAAIQMLDVHFPTTDGRELVFARYTQPEKDHRMLLAQLGWELPPQSPPRITQEGELLKE